MGKRGTLTYSLFRILFVSALLLGLGSCRPKQVPAPHKIDAGNWKDSQALVVLAKVRALLERSDFEAHVLTIGGKMTLAVWYVVNPNDAWMAREQEHFPCPSWPEQAALLMVHMIVESVPETRGCIEIFNPMLVTKDHVCIMLDMIDVTRVPEQGFADCNALVEYLRNLESQNYFFYNPDSEINNIIANNAGWENARKRIKKLLGEGNTAVYRIIGAPIDAHRPKQVTVYVQFQRVIPEGNEASVKSEIPDMMLKVFKEIRQTAPAPALLESFWVDSKGIMLYYARLEWRHAGGELPQAEDIEIRIIRKPQ